MRQLYQIVNRFSVLQRIKSLTNNHLFIMKTWTELYILSQVSKLVFHAVPSMNKKYVSFDWCCYAGYLPVSYNSPKQEQVLVDKERGMYPILYELH